MNLLYRNSNFGFYRIICHLFFIVLIIFSVVLFKERVLFVDSIYQFFKILQAKSINIEAGRYSVILPQFLSLLAIKLKFSLKAILIIYSLSYVLYFYFLYLICVYLLKSDVGGIVIVFILSLSFRQSFFHLIAEVHQGLIFTVLLYAWMNYPLRISNILKRRIVQNGVNVALILICYFSHPVTIFPLFFIIAYQLINKKEYKDLSYYGLFLLIFIIYAVKVIFTETQSYEGKFFAQLNDIFIILPNFFNLKSTLFLKDNFFTLYIFPFLILAIVLVYYFKKKEKVKFIFTIITILGFLFITNIIYHQGDSQLMLEKDYLPIIIFITLPFVNEILLKFNGYLLIKKGVFIFLISFSLIGIYKTSNIFTARLNYMQELLDYTKQYKERKFLLKRNRIDWSKVLITWGYGVETLFYSSLDGPSNTRTIFLIDSVEEYKNKATSKNALFIAPFERTWDINELDKRYFNLPPTDYRIIKAYFK